MRELRKFVLRTVFTVFSIMAMAAMFASCSSHGGSSDGGGAIYSGGGSSGSGNGSSPSSAGGGGTAQYSFHDGGTYSFNSHCGPYTVSRTSDGYKLCYLFSERNSSGSISSGTYNNWMLVYQSLTISDAGATEASCCSEGVWSYAGTGTVYNGNGQMSYDMPYKFYKVNP